MPGVLVAVGVVPATAPSASPCGTWASDSDVCSPCTEETDLVPWLQVATDLLYELSGQRFPGMCSDLVRPCRVNCSDSGPPYYDDTPTWHGLCSCGGDPCGCATLPELTLSGWPLVSTDEILIDGAVLDPAAYRIDDWKTLVRIDGEQWPACQDLSLATTEADTFSIEFTYGYPPPPAGVAAAAEMACQLALACAGSSECRLPQRVQSVTRQGVSLTFLDPFNFLEQGRTGLYLTDLFLETYGVGARKRLPAVITNIDMQRRVRRTTS